MIRVLVVDDSAFMRRVISRILEKDKAVHVVGTAGNGAEAIEKVEELSPDVVTLDIEMPVMDGLEALKHIMVRHPLPVIMLSAVTKEGAQITFDALALGACDFIAKDLANGASDIFKIEEELLRKVRHVARRKMGLLPKTETRKEVEEVPSAQGHFEILSLGASTGGPPALQHILTNLPGDFPIPIAVAQHMPKLFTQSFAERLNSHAKIHVKEAENREVLRPGVALIAPGDSHMTIRKRGRDVVAEFSNDNNYIYRPSVDFLMMGTAAVYGRRSIAVILTGMGSDGVVGLREIKSQRGFIIAQNEETCVVYGMPRAAVEAHLPDVVLPLHRIPEEIMRLL